MAFEVHGEDLIALVRRSGRLEDEARAVEREVRLGVLDSVRELAKVREVVLAGVGWSLDREAADAIGRRRSRTC